MTRRLSGWLDAYGMIDNDKLDTYITVTATNARVRTASDNARKVFFRVKNLSLLTARNNIGQLPWAIQRRRWPALSGMYNTFQVHFCSQSQENAIQAKQINQLTITITIHDHDEFIISWTWTWDELLPRREVTHRGWVMSCLALASTIHTSERWWRWRWTIRVPVPLLSNPASPLIFRRTSSTCTCTTTESPNACCCCWKCGCWCCRRGYADRTQPYHESTECIIFRPKHQSKPQAFSFSSIAIDTRCRWWTSTRHWATGKQWHCHPAVAIRFWCEFSTQQLRRRRLCSRSYSYSYLAWCFLWARTGISTDRTA